MIVQSVATLCAVTAVGGAARARAQARDARPPAGTASAANPIPPLRGIAVDERLDAEAVLLAALPPSTPGSVPLPLIVRIAVDAPGVRGNPSDLVDLDQRIGAYRGRNVTVIVAFGGFPATDADVEPWRLFIRAAAERSHGQVAGYQVGEIAAGEPPPPVDRYAFLLKLAAVQLRSVDPDALVVEGGVPASFDEWQARLYAAGVAPYVDAVAVAGPPATDDDVFRARVARMMALVEREDPTSAVVLGPFGLSGPPDASVREWLDSQIRSLVAGVNVTSYAGEAAAIRAALTAAARASDLFAGTLVTVDERAAGLRLSRGGTEVTGSFPHRLLFSTSGFATYLVYGGGQDTASMDVDVSVASATSPRVRDLLTGAVEKPARVQTLTGNRLSLTVPVAVYPLILDFNSGASDVFALSSDVQKEALPAVAEIIARHQQVQAAQDAAVQDYLAHMRIEQHFHPSPADPSYNIVTENRLFFERGAVEWEELSFSLNGATWTSNRPSFPLVQPEKVLSLPLDLRLTQDYSYRLDGVELVMGRPAYVVRFDPVSSGKALYHGTVWIDRELFVRLKVRAVETHLTGSIVSNDETQTFVHTGDVQGRPIWLLDRLDSQQVFLIAGRTVLVEREARMTDVVINAEEFEAGRAAARASNRIMYRDTDQGLRYLVKKGETRVVSDRMTTSSVAMALGADVDPSFDFPLPIGGLDILDFNFLKKDMQLALLFGGVIALGNVQHANMWGGRFDASVDFFGFAIKSNDSVFNAAGERSGERVMHIPAATGVNLGFQATPFQKITGTYEFKYDAYSRDPARTVASFTIPSSTATDGAGVGYEYRRAGYSVLAHATAYWRTTWLRWGLEGSSFDPAAKDYTHYDAGVSKDFIFSTFNTIHLNGAYFGGDRLDRFSMYQFGLFDPTRMHGVPSAVRFGELAMLRGSYSFNLFDQYRFDLFLDHAIGRATDISNQWMNVTGVGLGLNLRAPRNTILRVDIGKGFLPDIYHGAGSTVVQILLLKPL
jgi:hypothetical protein